MMKKLCVCLAMVAMMTSACGSNNNTLAPTGGDASTGVLIMTYPMGMNQRPSVDWKTADATATKQCLQWGYKGAEAREGPVTTCDLRNSQGNCTRMTVTVTYQCLGRQ
jgi:predicted small secreted protein